MRETFGMPVEELTDEDILREIEFHKETIAQRRVGTPNVHARLANLEREAEKRKTKKKCYIAVNEDKVCLAYGYFQDVAEILEEAKKSDLHGEGIRIYVFEIANESRWDPEIQNFKYLNRKPSDSL